MVKESAWLLHQIGNKAPLATRDSRDVVILALTLVSRITIQDEAMDVAQFEPQGLMELRARPAPTRFPISILSTSVSNTVTVVEA